MNQNSSNTKSGAAAGMAMQGMAELERTVSRFDGMGANKSGQEFIKERSAHVFSSCLMQRK